MSGRDVIAYLIRWRRRHLGDNQFLLLISFLIGCVYAISDEVHQLLVPGRSGSIQDILLDCGGIILGVLIAAGIIRLVKKRQANAQTT